MRRKKETNLSGDPTSKTRACTNDSEDVIGGSRKEGKDSLELGRNAVKEVELGVIRSRQTRTTERGHSGGEDVAEEDGSFDVRQLCACGTRRRTFTVANVALNLTRWCGRSRRT